MKKIIVLILVLVMSLSSVGCSSETSNPKSPEESKTELKEEEKTNDTKKTDEEVIEEEIVKETTENIDNTLILKGKILGYNVTMGNGILLDEKLVIDSREVDAVFFVEDVITDLIPRKYMTYYFQGCTSLKEELYSQIDIQVKIDTNSYDYDSDYNITTAKIIEVVSLDGETNPRDKTNDEYPLDYYKTLFYTRVYYANSPRVSDIKEHYFYKNINDPVVGEDFKIAVDKILEKGLFIQMGEGEYYINETDEKYSDGEIEHPVVLNMEELKNGDEISGDMIIDNIEYTKGSDKVKFDLIGGTLVTGDITYDNDYYGGYILTVDNPYMFNSEIKVTLSETYTFNYKPGVLFIRNENFISDEYKQALKQGEKLEGKISIKDISFSAVIESESSESCDLTEFLDVSLRQNETNN